ncbi:MAG TPA: hypothetical protein VGB85_10605, partial [Nannocystis sp.]
AEAVGKFEEAYRCMPRDRKHDARWDRIAAYLDDVSQVPTASPEELHTQHCRTRALIEDYLASIPTDPRPKSAQYAEKELQKIEQTLATRSCPEPAAPARPERPKAIELLDGPGAPRTDTPRSDPAATTPDRAVVHAPAAANPARPLWIAAGVTGGLTLASAVLLGAGVSRGTRAEQAADQHHDAGTLLQLRDEVYARGASGNRLAIAGASLTAVLLVTTVALLVVGSRRSPPQRPLGLRVGAAGISVRF